MNCVCILLTSVNFSFVLVNIYIIVFSSLVCVMHFFYNINADINHFEQLYPSIEANSGDQYHESDRFSGAFCMNIERDLSVIHLNIRSISANEDALYAYMFLLNSKFDVICLSESWVKSLNLLMTYFRIILASIL